ncbi:MAG: TIGR00266 family protein [bacterium]|nr:TIGR00266 family protein [bacterium]
MTTEILLRPSYSALKCVLNTGEAIRTETGAMLAMDDTAEIEGKMQGGAWKAIKRTVLTSESFFVTTIKAKQDNSEVYLAPRSVGDVEVLALNNEEYIVQGGSYLASEVGVESDAHFSGWKGFVSGEGIFMIKVKGTGKMFISSFGGIIKKTLAQGETFIVDNGHIVAFPSSIKYDLRAAGKGMLQMVTTGEGLVCAFEGPGTIYMQTRNLRTFAESLNPFLRERTRSQGKGILGGLLGG